jgi:hypothetical protein
VFEAETVYQSNLARRKHGVPPLRWNRQLTEASRWFSWDSIENREPDYCGHQDSQGNFPDTRAIDYGYKGFAGAENAFCGNVSPEGAIEGWLNSPGHRANLLDSGHREIGLGTYHRGSSGRHYTAQMFGFDRAYPPVIINNEALSTTSPNVQLYIHRNEGTGGILTMGQAEEMMVSNNPTFAGASWEPYVSEKAWTLDGGEGWRTVYVRLRDRFNRTVTVNDTIYLGEQLSIAEVGESQMTTTQDDATITNLDNAGLPFVQFSPGWLADDSQEGFKLWWGNGVSQHEFDAIGGTAFRLSPGDGESFAWISTTDFPKDLPMVAYFRLSVTDNSSASEVARISVEAAGQSYGLTKLKGTDFTDSGVFQEFAVPFTFNTSGSDVFLNFNVWRSGSTDVLWDAVSIFSNPQSVKTSLKWQIPGGNYRGQGIWVRYTDNNGRFSAMEEANVEPLTPPAPEPRPVSPTPTNTPMPTDTPMPMPTDTPMPMPTDTPMPMPTDNPMPMPTDNPMPTSTKIPTTGQPRPTATPTPPIAQNPTPVPSGSRCFEETGYCMSGRIRIYWEQNGGLPVFGYPIGPQQEELVEGQPFQVQWFERNRLELHPENAPPYDVLLGRLSVDVLDRQGRDWQDFPLSPPQGGCRYFEQTGQNVCGDIWEAWRSNGLEIDGVAGISEEETIALFGLPISGIQRERLSDGREYEVQWFERARFERHPENDPPYHVLLGLLGNELRGQ